MGSRSIVSAIIALRLAAASGPLAGQQLAPSSLTAVPQGKTTIQLSWPAAPGAKGYRVQRGPVGGTLADISALLTGTSYLDAAAPNGVDLSYRIKTSYPVPAGQQPIIRHSPLAVVKWSDRAPANTASSDNKQPPSPATVPGSPVAVSPNRSAKEQLARPSSGQFAEVPGASAPPAPSPPAPVVSGRYRVVANGFSVVQQAHSHHDDVYGGFVMLHFNRQTGELLDRDGRHTKVLGDINGRVFGETDGGDFNRLRAGTASASGGLKNGDSYPDAGHARFRGQDGTPPNRVTFPFEIWTGDLTNATDAVVILPTLWSRDGKLSGFDQWQSSELTAGSQIWYDQAVQQALRQTSLGVVAPPGAITPNGNQMFAQLANLVGAATLGGLGQPWALAFAFDPSAHDFPIGFDRSAKALPRRAIVLTREMIEQALNSPKVQLNSTMVVPNYPAWILPYLDVPVGVIPVLLFDYVPPPGEPLRTAYVMYLQVERM